MSQLSGQTCECPQTFVGPSMANACGGGAFLTFMTILEAYIIGRCDISDHCNRIQPKQLPDFEYDFIVVGGGTAGPVVAARLSENPLWKVLLIEAGDDEPTQAQVPGLLSSYWGNPAADWMYKTDPQSSACLNSPEKRCSWPRAKLLGGCSVFNFMMYMRGHPRDYDNWVKDGGLTGWSYSDVLPYFKKSENNQQIDTLVDSKYHATGGYMNIEQFRYRPEFAEDLLQAADELGFGTSNDLNGDKVTGFCVTQSNTRDGMRLSAARAFLRPASKRPNLHVMVNSTATRVIVDPKTKNVDGVEFVYKDRTFFAKATKEIILSAGAVNSPQLLLLSGIGPKEDLEKLNITIVNDLPGVGKNLHNHVAFSVKYYLDKSNDTNNLNWVSITDYLLQRKGPLSSTGMGQVTAKLNSKYADKDGLHPDVQLFFSGFETACAESGALTELNTPDNKRTLSVFGVAIHPKSRGHIGLRSANPFEAPVMQPNYLSEDYDIKVLLEVIKIMLKLEDSKILKEKYGIRLDKTPLAECVDKGEWGSDEYWECAIRHNTGPENHQVGSCKMGPSNDKLAVLDSQMKVYGINGLRVMDTSVFPSITSGNTGAPAMMVAEMGADFIKNDWRFKQSTTSANGLGNRFGPENNNNGQSFGNGYPSDNTFNRPYHHNWHWHRQQWPFDGIPYFNRWLIMP